MNYCVKMNIIGRHTSRHVDILIFLSANENHKHYAWDNCTLINLQLFLIFYQNFFYNNSSNYIGTSTLKSGNQVETYLPSSKYIISLIYQFHHWNEFPPKNKDLLIILRKSKLLKCIKICVSLSYLFLHKNSNDFEFI